MAGLGRDGAVRRAGRRLHGGEYAGWKVQQGDFFAMASGPMRAAAGKETLLETLGISERPEMAVGVLESRRLPPADVLEMLGEACGVKPAAVDDLGGADRQPGRHGANRGPLAGDGFAQTV